jgi:branched-subunit amino acid transport protein
MTEIVQLMNVEPMSALIASAVNVVLMETVNEDFSVETTAVLAFLVSVKTMRDVLTVKSVKTTAAEPDVMKTGPVLRD